MFSGFGADSTETRSVISRPKPSRPAELGGVVGDEAHRGDAQVVEDLRTDAVLAAVDRQARAPRWPRRCRGPAPAGCTPGSCGRCRCRGPRGHAGRRGRPGPPRRSPPWRPSSCTPQSQRIEWNTSPVRHSECTRTSTSRSPCDRALDHRHVLLAVEQRLVHVAGEVAPEGGDAGLGDAADQLLGLSPVLDQLGDRDHQEVVLLAELDEVGDTRHRAVVVDDLAEHTGRVEPARRARSTAASVWPARLSTPPSA
jgi:hypothetical protein